MTHILLSRYFKFVPPLVFLLALTAIWSPGATHAAERQVNVVLDWIPDGMHTPIYSALENGFYSDEGLSVQLSRGYGSVDTARKIAGKQYDIGLGALTAVIKGRANENLPVKAIMVYLTRDMSAIWVRDNAGIDTPKDLEGKTIGAPAGDVHRIFFPEFGKRAGFDADKVEWLTVEGAAKAPMLINGQVDAVPYFAYHGARLGPQAAKRGFGVKSFPYADYGLTIYGTSFMAHDDTIETEPEMLSKFVRGTLRGMRWAAAHPREAAEILVKDNVHAAVDTTQAEWMVTQQFIFTEEAEADGLGRYNMETLKETIVAHEAVLDRIPAVDEVATTEFLPSE